MLAYHKTLIGGREVVYQKEKMSSLLLSSSGMITCIAGGSQVTRRDLDKYTQTANLAHYGETQQGSPSFWEACDSRV